MSCERFREALTQRAAGGPVSAGLESHLDACADCRRELLELREALGFADAALGGLAVAEPSPEFRARLRQRVDEARGEIGGDRLARRWPWLASAATICAAVVLAVLWRGGAVARQQVASVAVPAPVATTTATAAAEPARTAGRELVAPTGDTPARLPWPARPAAPRRANEPEVLVPAGEQQALLEFVALVHAQKASPAGLLAADEPSPDLAEPRDIRIVPLEIAPLDPAEAQGM
jgi:hypothetical protein